MCGGACGLLGCSESFGDVLDNSCVVLADVSRWQILAETTCVSQQLVYFDCFVSVPFGALVPWNFAVEAHDVKREHAESMRRIAHVVCRPDELAPKIGNVDRPGTASPCVVAGENIADLLLGDHAPLDYEIDCGWVEISL